MDRIPMSAACTPCLGVCCAWRGSCDNYAAVEQAVPGDPALIATCVQADHARPLYLPLRWVEPEAVAA